ncbi:MAG TPA: GcrA family cell cycle regulator [Sphingomonas sp.]|jgi:GcrA cell cycle regulator|uniref:GcrA family cell cycle regulator n=1 Tax=Sphingomonas sp. TaxID=28214 RepID=UPI002EDB1D2C
MSWTDERIETLKTMWEAGQTASQIAEGLGGVSRNAVIGKAHRLGLQSRPSPVRPNEPAIVAEPEPVAEAPPPMEVEIEVEPMPEPVVAIAPEPDLIAADEPEEMVDDEEEEGDPVPQVAAAPQPVLRSVGPGGFLRQTPGEQQAPLTPAPPRRLVPAKPSPEIAGKTTLLDLSERVCKWPLGHPGEADFHFCGDKVNPGFPYCVAHCGHAYQAQLPRRDRRPPPPLPFGGPRVR